MNAGQGEVRHELDSVGFVVYHYLASRLCVTHDNGRKNTEYLCAARL